MIKPLLIVFAKAPRLGAGKTRLAKSIGAVEALRVNRWMQARALRAASDPRWRTILAVAPDRALRLRFPGVWPKGARMAQGGGDLGARLARALKPHRRVAVIGVDCPDLSRVRIAQAFRALRRADFVLGPSEDGGFYLLAARKGEDAARAMRGVRWSSSETLRDVESNLKGSIVRLKPLRDVDTLEDLRVVRAQRPSRG